MNVELRERSFGEMVGQSFSLTVAHFWRLLAIIIPFSLPNLALQLIQVETQQTEDPNPFILLAFLLIMLLVAPIMQGASVLLVASSFTGASPSMGECFGAAFRRFWHLLLLGAAVGIIVFLGAMLLIVPGLMFFTWYYMAGPALMVEEIPWRDAMSRSKKLSEGFRWEILGYVLVTAVLLQVIPAMAAGAVAGLTGIVEEGVPGIIFVWVLEVVVSTVGVVAPVVYYFNQRVRREGFDLEALTSLVDAIGRTRPATA